MEAAQKKDAGKATSAFSDYDHSNFYYGAGEDPLNLLGPFSDWYAEALPNGYYLYSEPLQSAPGTRVLSIPSTRPVFAGIYLRKSKAVFPATN